MFLNFTVVESWKSLTCMKSSVCHWPERAAPAWCPEREPNPETQLMFNKNLQVFTCWLYQTAVSSCAYLRWCITKLRASLTNWPFYTHSLLGNVPQEIRAAFGLRMIFSVLLHHINTLRTWSFIQGKNSTDEYEIWPCSGRCCELPFRDSCLLCSLQPHTVSEPADGACQTIKNDL